MRPDQRELLPRSFFDRPATEVAPDLLGCIFWSDSADGRVAVRLVEVEAYMGGIDPASHSFRGETKRNAVMFGPPGHAYVYFTYGMHFCVNFVCSPPGEPTAVLLRAGEVIEGAELAASRRLSNSRPRDLARGPARLCQALSIDRGLDGIDVCVPGSALGIGPRVTAVDPPGHQPRPQDRHHPGARPAVAILAGRGYPRFLLSGGQTAPRPWQTGCQRGRPGMGRCSGERHHR